MIRVAIFEDNRKFRESLSVLVDGSEDFTLVGAFPDATNVITKIEQCEPHIILMDIKMPKMDGLTATFTIKNMFPDANICIVTDYGDQKTREAASAAGARAYVVKEELHKLRAVISSRSNR